jgi:hypothetical protein
VGGMKILLKKNGVITMEFPHLLQLIQNNQFDTIYHEHFSYLSFTTVKKIFESQGLQLFDVDQLQTHGGSLRIYAKHDTDDSKTISQNVTDVLQQEREAGMTDIKYYSNFGEKVLKVKIDLLMFLAEQKKQSKIIAAYGAAAKGNTLLNYCGVKNDMISYVIDANPHKQNKFLPASHIPVVNELHLRNNKPDFVVILPWNLKDEIITQLQYIREWGGKFVIPIPQLQII